MNNYITGITHCSFFCKDYEKMLTFYRDIMGLEFMFTLRNEDGTPWITYLKVADRQFVELFNTTYSGDNKWASTSFSHLALVVDDIFETAHTLESKGVVLTKGPKDVSEIWRIPYVSDSMTVACGSRVAWVQDPEGNEIELMEYTPISVQTRCI